MTVWLADAVLAVVLLTAVATDLARGKIYNWLTYPAVLAGLVIWSVDGAIHGGFGGAMHGLLWAVLGLMVAFVPMMVAFALGGIGGGDAKFAAAIGALLLPPTAVFAMFYGFVVAALLAVLVMVRRRVARQTMSRVWRFLWLLATGARPVSPTDDRSPRIATALPWAIGAAWAVLEQHVFAGRMLIDRLM